MNTIITLKSQVLEFTVGKQTARLALPYNLVDDQRILDRVGLLKLISEWSRVQHFKPQSCLLVLDKEIMFGKIVTRQEDIGPYWDSIPVPPANLAKMIRPVAKGWELWAADRIFFLGIKRALEGAGWKVTRVHPWPNQSFSQSYQNILLFIQWLVLLLLLLALVIWWA